MRTEGRPRESEREREGGGWRGERMCKTLLTVGKKSLSLWWGHTPLKAAEGGVREEGGREGGGVNSCLGHDVHLPGADGEVRFSRKHHCGAAPPRWRRKSGPETLRHLSQDRTSHRVSDSRGRSGKNTVFKTFSFNQCVKCQVVKQFYLLYFSHWKDMSTTFVLKRFSTQNHLHFVTIHSIRLCGLCCSKFSALEFTMLVLSELFL